MSGKFEKRGREIGILVDKKNAAYGDAFALCGDFLKIMFPNGVEPDRYQDMLALVRVFDKLCRIAKGDKKYFPESPWQDIAGYGILSAEFHRKAR